MATKSIKLFYDNYEKNFGDGFYPQTYSSKGLQEIVIEFVFIDGCWKQNSEDPITGFDGNERNVILNLLNDNKNYSSVILDKLGYLI
jgi:hypothetical protein